MISLVSAASLCLGFLACLSLRVPAFAVQQGRFQTCRKLFPSMLPLCFPVVESPTQRSMETRKLVAIEGHSWYGGAFDQLSHVGSRLIHWKPVVLSSGGTVVCCDVGIMEGHLENNDTLPSKEMWPSSFHPMFYKHQKGTCDLTPDFFSSANLLYKNDIHQQTTFCYLVLHIYVFFRLHHIRTTLTLRIQDYVSIFAMSFIIIF